MKNLSFIITSFFLISINLSNTLHWLAEIDCEENLNLFEIRTLNTYNLNQCEPTHNNCGEYINLMSYSIFHNNQSIEGECYLSGRKIQYLLRPANLSNSEYDTTPHFLINLFIDDHQVLRNLPIFPSPIYNQILWGLKVSSIRFNANTGSITVIVSDDEHYEQTNNAKMNSITTWLWDSDYKSAFDPDWESKWKALDESDIWNVNNIKSYK